MGLFNIFSKKHKKILISPLRNPALPSYFEGNKDVIKGCQWMATLDTRTCVKCASLDLLQWDLKNNPMGHNIGFVNLGDHDKCRCIMLSVLKTWESLGLGPNRISKGMRTSMKGLVPANTRFIEWIAEQSRLYIDEWVSYQTHECVNDFLTSPYLNLWDGVMLNIDTHQNKVDIKKLFELKYDLIGTRDPFPVRRRTR